jgi:acetyl-CoA acetyltransferase
MQFDNVVVAGYGETEYHKSPDDQRDAVEYVRDATRGALDDAGLGVADVDGFAVTSYNMDHVNAVELAHHFGIDGRWFDGKSYGNGSPGCHVVRAAEAIKRGKAETVVVAAGDDYSIQGNVDLMGKWHFLANYMYPYGMGGANSHFGMIQRRHMAEHGTTREQLANVAVTQREHALAHDNGLFEQELTTGAYLDARPVAEPVHLYDCVYPCGGGDAIVLTTGENAADLDTENVYVRAGEEYHDPNEQPFELASSLKHCRNIFDEAGAGGELVGSTDLSHTGELPLNTGGGQLSMGQAGGAGGLVGTVEAVRQLRGEGGDRQVPDCEVALAASFGNVTYGGGLSSGVNIFSTGKGASA